HTRFSRDWSSDVCSSDLSDNGIEGVAHEVAQNLTGRAGDDPFEQAVCKVDGPQEIRDFLPIRDGVIEADDGACKFWVDIVDGLRSEERRVGKECRSRGGW